MATVNAEAKSYDFGAYFGYASKACREYCEALVNDGWERIGESSCYGIVFRHPDHPDHVHKVAFRAKEDGWVEFVKYAIKNPNPHFPHVRGYQDFGDFVVADIECLKEVPDWSDAYDLGHRVSRATTAAREGNGYTFARILGDLNVELAKAVVALKEHFMDTWKVDLHPGNFMMRGDTLIINDPLSWRLGQG